MKLIAILLRFFNRNITVAALLLKREIERRCGFAGPIEGELRHLSRALDCFAAYEAEVLSHE